MMEGSVPCGECAVVAAETSAASAKLEAKIAIERGNKTNDNKRRTRHTKNYCFSRLADDVPVIVLSEQCRPRTTNHSEQCNQNIITHIIAPVLSPNHRDANMHHPCPSATAKLQSEPGRSWARRAKAKSLRFTKRINQSDQTTLLRSGEELMPRRWLRRLHPKK